MTAGPHTDLGRASVPASPARSSAPVGLGLAGTLVLPKFVKALLEEAWKRYRKGLKRCRHKFTAEAVHDFRIHIRRLLSCLELLEALLPPRRTRKLYRLLKRRLDLFDELRDTQVQLQTLTKLRATESTARLFRKHLREREERFGRRVRKQLRKAGARRVGALIEESRERLEERLGRLSADRTAAALLAPLERSFRETCRLRAQVQAADAATIHHTRVAFKHFRYMVEALAPAIPALTADRLAALRHYQTLMGDVQDAVVLLAAFDEFQCKCKPAASGARALRRQLLRRRQRLIHLYLGAANDLLTFWPPAPCDNN